MKVIGAKSLVQLNPEIVEAGSRASPGVFDFDNKDQISCDGATSLLVISASYNVDPVPDERWKIEITDAVTGVLFTSLTNLTYEEPDHLSVSLTKNKTPECPLSFTLENEIEYNTVIQNESGSDVRMKLKFVELVDDGEDLTIEFWVRDGSTPVNWITNVEGEDYELTACLSSQAGISCEGATNKVILAEMLQWLHNESGDPYYVTVTIGDVSELKNTSQRFVDFINDKFGNIVIAKDLISPFGAIEIRSISNDETFHMSIVRDTTQVVTPQLFYTPWDINGLNTLLALQAGQSLSPSYDDLAVVDVDLQSGTVVGKENRLTIKDSRYAGWNVTAAEFRAGDSILFIKLENTVRTRAALVAVTRSVFGGNYDTLMTIPFNEYNIETSDTADMSPDGKFITYAVRNPNDGNSWGLSCYMRTADTSNYASITGMSLVVSTSNVTNVRYEQNGTFLMWAIGGRIYSSTVRNSDGALLNTFDFAAISTGVNTAVWTGGDVFNADQSLVKYCSRQADQIWLDGAINWGDGFYFLVANNVGWIRFSVSPREAGIVSIGFARIVGHSITKTIDAVPLDATWNYPVLYKMASKALNVNMMTGAIAEVDLTAPE